MTTTKTKLEIENDLAAQLEAAAKARGVSLRDYVAGVLKDTVSRGAPVPVPPVAPYVLKTYDFGVHIESPWTVLADLESQEYAPKVNKK